MPRPKVKANAVQIPGTQEEAEVILGQIGNLQRKLTFVETAMNDKLAAVQSRYKKQAEQIIEEINAAFKRLHGWAEAHKNSLLRGKRKSADISTGRLSWRKTPPKVNVKNTEDAIKELKRRKLKRFIKTTEVIDKEAILADPGAIKGLENLSVTHRTEFVAKPHDSDIEKVTKAKE